jgi:hypothetical protein
VSIPINIPAESFEMTWKVTEKPLDGVRVGNLRIESVVPRMLVREPSAT